MPQKGRVGLGGVTLEEDWLEASEERGAWALLQAEGASSSRWRDRSTPGWRASFGKTLVSLKGEDGVRSQVTTQRGIERGRSQFGGFC